MYDLWYSNERTVAKETLDYVPIFVIGELGKYCFDCKHTAT